MNIEEVERRLAAVGGALLPGQRCALMPPASNRSVVIVEGDIGAGKSFTVVPWLLSRNADVLHGMAAPTMRAAHEGVLREVAQWLRRLGIEYVYGTRPPRDWRVAQLAADWRDVLTTHNGVQVKFISLHGRPEGWRFGSLFCEIDRPVDEERAAVAVRHARRSLVTTHNAGGVEAALAREGVQRDTARVLLNSHENPHLPISYRRFLSGERVNA